jgi:hypothetical protein
MSNTNTAPEAQKPEEKNAEHRGWVGVDLDGTLARYDGWKGAEHIGEPVPEMVRKVKAMLAAGEDVRIFTARAYPHRFAPNEITEEEANVPGDMPMAIGFRIQQWCKKHLGQILWITCSKDYGMKTLYDDRCVFVFPNEGTTHHEHQGAMQAALLGIATAAGVRVESGMQFNEVAERCVERVCAGNPKADQAEAVLALIDGAVDAISYALPSTSGPGHQDLKRAQQNIRRALPLLRELAGKKE